MFFKLLFSALFTILLTCSVKLSALGNKKEIRADFESFNRDIHHQSDFADSVWQPSFSPFVELLGKGFISLNLDYRRKETYAISIGIAGIEEGISPNVMAYYLPGKRHRIEIAGGISGNFSDGSVVNTIVHGVIGYRYQKKKGLLFRAGFTPMFVIPFTDNGKYAFIPWAGISFGYCF
jgi:hypothetical protein